MTSEDWNKLDIKEQLSNVHGEVKRLVRARNNYKRGVSKEDYTMSYMNKIHNLILLTCEDPKNKYREKELVEEENEIKRWLNGEEDDDYILRYWSQYTNAIS
ncbi:MAG: hypothetical protein J6M44_15700 [Butyrivibrio sp.]|uniref:hypothetical protein n=1 Tax=Butyrivibrio sp. TaxID=28121 RepID=UPI001B4F415D|nr:hypothetical protein [Butyrivibrio sp.]MBP3280392.1 hypothetical protein [Butyrivibrio sp.]MBP3783697.1 hypothetical protein [Butyrivibrio sp.]